MTQLASLVERPKCACSAGIAANRAFRLNVSRNIARQKTVKSTSRRAFEIADSGARTEEELLSIAAALVWNGYGCGGFVVWLPLSCPPRASYSLCYLDRLVSLLLLSEPMPTNAVLSLSSRHQACRPPSSLAYSRTQALDALAQLSLCFCEDEASRRYNVTRDKKQELAGVSGSRYGGRST